MLLNKILLFNYLLISTLTNAQVKIKGNVLNANNKIAIVNASVFISNSSIGTNSNSFGYFELFTQQKNKVDLVASCIGYKTKVIEIDLSKIEEDYNILLEPKTENLEEVVVEDYKKETWEKWGKFFTENFIGKNPNAIECNILNPEAITFKYSKKKNILMAYSDSFIIIENKALGYILKYQLENFEYNYKSGILYYEGYPLFEEMKTTKKRFLEKWKKNRTLAYYGSSIHFFKSLFSNQLEEEGYFIRKLVKVENAEKKRVQAIIKAKKELNKPLEHYDFEKLIGNKDSITYYRKILHQNDYSDSLEPKVLKAEKIAARTQDGKIIVFFTDYLHITYANGLEDENYLKFMGLDRYANNPISTLTLPNNNLIEIFSNGYYNSPKDLLRTGYWSWSEKISTLLPLDYEEE